MMGVVYDSYVYKLLYDILTMKKYPYDLHGFDQEIFQS